MGWCMHYVQLSCMPPSVSALLAPLWEPTALSGLSREQQGGAEVLRWRRAREGVVGRASCCLHSAGCWHHCPGLETSC